MPDLMCYGLDVGEDTFAELSSRNPIIFRVHSNSDEEAFVAEAFRHNRTQIPSVKFVSRSQVIHHIVQWITRDSPWISCTFSLPYVLWEATRRVASNPEVKRNLHISVIYAVHSSLEHRAILGVEALRGPIARSSSEAMRRAITFSRAFQEVLVYGQIPPDAVLVTLPWKKFKKEFRSTHLPCLTSDPLCQSSLRNYCERLREDMLQQTVEQAKMMAVQQSMIILGALYAKVGNQSELYRLSAVTLDLSRAIFSWPYRHASSLDDSYRDAGGSSVDLVFPHIKRVLMEIIEKHPLHREATLYVRLFALRQEIAEFDEETYATSSIRDASRSKLKKLREALVETISGIDALVKEGASASKDSVDDLTERFSQTSLVRGACLPAAVRRRK